MIQAWEEELLKMQKQFQDAHHEKRKRVSEKRGAYVVVETIPRCTPWRSGSVRKEELM